MKWVWESKNLQLISNDLKAFRRLLLYQVKRWKLTPTKLGEVAGEPLFIYHSGVANFSKSNKLVVAGFHGEEPAGVWGVLAFLQNNDPTDFIDHTIYMLPLINSHGFLQAQRLNSQGLDVNRGYSLSAPLTTEGKILTSHLKLLLHASRNGALTCHEDVTSRMGYIYSYEQRREPGVFSASLLSVLKEHFPLVKASKADGYDCSNGFIFNQPDDSFEYWLFTQGTPLVACSETPGLCDFDLRVAANAELIKHFIQKSV